VNRRSDARSALKTDSTVLDRGELSISSLARLAADEREALRAELVAALPDAKYTLPLAALAFTAVRQ
jgi:hypothetical protein